MKRSALLLLLGILANTASQAQALSGSYTINPALPPDAVNFTSISAAVTALTLNGVSGPVTFTAEPVVFNEQVSIPAISGASATNTITFSGDNAVLRYYSNNASQRAVLQLNGASHIVFDAFKIDAGATETSTYGYGVQLLNNADHNTISNCKINVPEYSNSSITDRYAGILLNSQANAALAAQGDAACDSNIIQNNTITGGQYGIAIVAQSNTFMVYGNTITGNTILDFYNAGIYVDGSNGSLIDNNDISRPSRSTAALFYGIQFNNNSRSNIISRNRIHDPFGGTTTYPSSGANPIYFSNVNASAGRENYCINNAIYNMQCGSIIRGLWITGSSYNKFIHNSVVLNQESFTGFGTTTGVEISGSNNLTIQNNIISITRTGSSFITRYGLNIGNSISGATIDHNNVYIANGTPFYYGNWNGTNAATLSAWATATGDMTSLDQDPSFAGISSGDLMPGNTAMASGTATNVTTDILNMARNAAPTMGAYEIGGTPLAVDMSVLSVNENHSGESVLHWSTYTEKDNNGFEILQSEDAKTWSPIGFEAAGGNTGRQYQYNVGIVKNSTSFFRIKQWNGNGTYTYSNIVKVAVKPSLYQSMDVYPNPVSNMLYVNTTGNAVQSVEIFTMNGQTVLKRKVNNTNNAIDVSTLPGGMYMLFVNGDHKTTKSFIKR